MGIITKILIRQFSIKDLKRIMEIECVSFAADAFSKSTFISFYNNYPDLFIIAEISGLIVGYMITCIVNKIGRIDSIAVDPYYRRKGIGRKLANYTFSQLKTSCIKIIELEVRVNNIEGICFWKSLSFFPLRIISNYYSDGTDALKMQMLLYQ
jgi:ribosomal-protein-alanine N-acetyltransferase